MKYLMSVWCDDCFRPVQVNGTVYRDDGSLLRMDVWVPEAQGLANAIYEVADRLAQADVQLGLWEDAL